MRIRNILATLLLFMISVSVFAIERPFPSDAKRGVASFNLYPKIYIDGMEYRPAPGLRIWDTRNMIQFQTAIKAENVIINYTVDPYRLIDKIWILTPAEAAKSLQIMGRTGNTTNITITVPTTTTKSGPTVTITNQ